MVTKTRFEKEAKGNSKMASFSVIRLKILRNLMDAVNIANLRL